MLRSVALQTHDRIDVVVILTGQPHEVAMPSDWNPDHTIRWSAAAALTDAQAGNRALDQIRGQFFCFLDAGVAYRPDHIRTLLQEAARHSESLVVYARGTIGERTFGRPYNRALFLNDRMFCLSSAIIRRRAIELGCRFDESIDIGSDFDFIEQIAQFGELTFLPALPPTFVLSPQPQPDVARRIYFDNLRLAKWKGEHLYHNLRCTALLAAAETAMREGDIADARIRFTETLNRYPDHPDALHGLARCALAEQRPADAFSAISKAIDLDPEEPDYQATASAIRAALPKSHSAHPSSAAVASVVAPKPEQQVVAVPVLAAPTALSTPPPVSRTALCPCGSGKRYKHCCGRQLENEADALTELLATRALIAEAGMLLAAGNGDRAATMLATLQPDRITSRALMSTAGRLCIQLDRRALALAFLRRAIELDGGREALGDYDECCELVFRAMSRQSAGRTITRLLQQLNERHGANSEASDRIHIVCTLDSIGGTERRAVNLYDRLSPSSRATLWSTTPPLPIYSDSAPIRQIRDGDVPSGGTLVLVGTYYPCGAWLEESHFDRVVICHNLSEQYWTLMERLLQLERNPSHPAVGLTLPSHLFRNAISLPGAVEYAFLDTHAFRPRTRSLPDDGGCIRVGRHGRAYGLKFHPNDPAFFRTLMSRGYAVSILGGTTIAPAFANDGGAKPRLLAAGSERVENFLETLDIFLYRKHPQFFESGGTAILEAMAMELPVVVFREECGIAELIDHGQNGFLVDTEAEALELIDRLASDRVLRDRIGRAARTTIVELMQRQNISVVEFYLGAGARASSESARAVQQR